MLYITDSAQTYLAKLLSKKKQGTQIRLSIEHLQTPHAQCTMNYYLPKNNSTSDDIIIKLNHFSIYLKKKFKPFIKDTKIDIITDTFGIQISIYSPYLNKTINDNKTKKITKNPSELENKIKYVLENQINPQLAMHGGSVSLIKITKNSLAVLQFHGGCNGCAMAAYTIKEGIEITLKKIFPELKGIIDSTVHQRGTHSFY